MSKKVRGKRPAVDEPVQKRRKTASFHAHKPGGISLGEDRIVRPRQTAMLEWSDDDEDQSTLPPSMMEAPTDADAPEQQARESFGRATVENPVMQTTEVPEQQEGITAEQSTEGGPRAPRRAAARCRGAGVLP